jgi:endonuclease/exonuclease/phosphatase family metal-dependent hydrolase
MPRILTYNVHRCLGTDGMLSPKRIAHVIESCRPDIVALQELDVRRARTGGVDQAHAIAEELGMRMHFHPALCVLEEMYGDAILTPHSSRLMRAGALPSLARRPLLEPRGALWVAVEINGVWLNLVNTHLGLSARERKAQVEALLGPEWLGNPLCRDPVVLLGDFNAVPRSSAYRRLASRLRDAAHAGPNQRAKPTFPAYLPVLRIDHVFVSQSVRVLDVSVPRTSLMRAASDHLPLWIDIEAMPPRSRQAADADPEGPCGEP